ncbi:MAG TPA: AarF/UbiB family protein, partial [Polyangia bacterium]
MSKDPLQQLLETLRAKEGVAIPTSSFGRLQKTATAVARVGVGTFAGRLRGGEFNLGSLSPQAVAKLVESLGELKGVAMKVGQLLSYVDSSLSPEARRLLAVLQVMSQPTAFSHIQRTIGEDLGARGRALLARLDRAPVASASIGQVHRARFEDGTSVAVKVRHPGIEEAIRTDFKTAAIGTLFARLVAPGMNVQELLAETEARFLEECDYGLEASRQIRFGEIFAKHPFIHIPAVRLDLSGRRVLTTTWQDGMSLDGFLAGTAYQAERVRAARSLYEFYVGALYRHGLFNADPHPGNLL